MKAVTFPEISPQNATNAESQTGKEETGRLPPIVLISVINYEVLWKHLKGKYKYE